MSHDAVRWAHDERDRRTALDAEHRPKTSRRHACRAAGLESVWKTEFHDPSADRWAGAVPWRRSGCTVGSADRLPRSGRTRLWLAARGGATSGQPCQGAADPRARDGHAAGMQQELARAGRPASAAQRHFGGEGGVVRGCGRCCGCHEGPLEHEGRFYRTVVIHRPVPPRRERPADIQGRRTKPAYRSAGPPVADGLVGHRCSRPEYTRDVFAPGGSPPRRRDGRAAVPVRFRRVCHLLQSRRTVRGGRATVMHECSFVVQLGCQDLTVR